MDTLLVPHDPTLPREQARYVCKEPWDGGTFLTYARRQGRMRTVPERLRQYTAPRGSTPSGLDEDEEFTEHILPTPQPEQEAFLQTWLFFGLLAEFFGLNENDAGERLVDAKVADREIATLYEDYVEEIDSGHGNGTTVKYITGAQMLQAKDAPVLIVTRLRLAGPAIEQRIQHLHRCLSFSCFLLNTAIQTAFDPAIKTSIAALGELLSTGFATASALKRIPSAGVSFSFAWADRYLEDGGQLEGYMLTHGWCSSEVEKIRSVNQGLGTRHYLSRLRKGGPQRDHSSCSKEGCVAFQIDAATYRPSHVQQGCSCGLQAVDTAAVQQVLKETSGYPVLDIRPVADGDGQALKMTVEPYSDSVPYVAISHVWADGMGNPTANSLPACQIAKVARLVSQLQITVSAGKTSSPTTGNHDVNYRVWIDPLLCPIEAVGKKLSLQRIPDVYRNATHVLVLDSSLMVYSAEDLSPEEILVRIFSSSAWMRRLWTLQEGALAQSLYFQFSDHAVMPTDEMAKLYMKGLGDARYMRIWQDIAIEQVHLRGWFKSIEDETKPSALSLVSLQRALHFRTVSDPADEPLCIATLLSLDQAYVVAASALQDRMVRVWELVAKKLGGSVPARILFSSDETLDVPGWRWAPRSLLGASYAAKDSAMDVHHRIMRFQAWRSDRLVAEDLARNSGVPTPWGLRVKMGGYILKSVPLLPHLPLHPWERVAGSHEDMILVKHSASGRWLRLMDFYRLEMGRRWSPEQRREYDRKTDNLLCRLIDGGRQALLCDQNPRQGQHYPSLMVRLEDGWNQLGEDRARQTMRARRERMVILDWASHAHTIVADGLEELAMKAAQSDVTEQFVKAMDTASDWEQGRIAMDAVKEYMKAVVARKWKSDATFVEAVRDTRGPNMENHLWAEIHMRFSHSIVCEEVPDSQVWLVD